MLLQEAFKDRGIVPSNYARYHIQALQHALDDKYGVMPHITCDAQGELAEVRQQGQQHRLLLVFCFSLPVLAIRRTCWALCCAKPLGLAV
jgi:hypothetical protein